MSLSDQDLEKLGAVLEKMLLEDENITTRNIIARLPRLFRHPTDITRPPAIRELYIEAKEGQKNIRLAAAKLKDSKNTLAAKIETQAQKIASLEADLQLLVASHKAMYAAVGEIGALKAWLAFFERHQDSLDALTRLKAVPPMSSPKKIKP
ncbi:hypothetical protein [Qipengyuania nanhaisediminis]|uniref:Uncharacterized protein n=1 Tax=Qipengyuania nanhaisediminis TaxID=604088 RepID=A0A1I5MII3_9SPHN|nr:hypothetical protein [Qipengyuania nanhaisediminis]SFP09339.1 hypothetical protein SAMN04488060_1385 [Qipengyuania nanhaisediminis]